MKLIQTSALAKLAFCMVGLVPGESVTATESPRFVVTRDHLIQTLTFSGDLTTESLVTVTVPRVSRTSSFAISYLAPEGHAVKEGELLAQLDAPELAAERFVVERQREDARTQIAQKEAELEGRYQDLLLSLAVAEGRLAKSALHVDIDPSLIPRSEVERYRFEHESASIEVGKAKAQMATFQESRVSEMAVVRLAFEQADLRFGQLGTELRKLAIRAPSPGLVIHANNPQRAGRFQIGDMAWTGLTLLYLPDMARLQVRAYVYDEDLPLLEEGMDAEVTFDSLPDRPFQGVLGRIPDMARPRDYGTSLNAFPLDIGLLAGQPGLKKLRPGATARIRVPVVREESLLVPRVALHVDGGGQASVRTENQPRRTVPVRVLDGNHELVSVEGDLQPGDALIEQTTGDGTTGTAFDWISLKRQDLLFSVSGSGHLRAQKAEFITPPLLDDGQDFKVSFAIAEGAEVQPGDLLIAFDTSHNEALLREESAALLKAGEEARQAEAALQLQVQEMEMLLEEARAALTRQETKLRQAEQFESGLQVQEARLDAELGRKTVVLLEEKLQAVRQRVELQIKTVRDRVGLYRRRVEQQRANIRALSVTSPVAGVVVYSTNSRKERKQVGSEVQRLEQIMELPDLTTLILDGRVAEIDSNRVQVGQLVEISIDAIPNQVFQGRVTGMGKIFNRIDFSRPGRVLSVQIELNNLDLARMRPRMAARFRVVLERLPDVLAVPLASVDLSQGPPAVWVKGAEGPERRSIQIGTSNEVVAVVVAGLEEGDEVASRPLTESPHGTESL